MLNSNWSVYDDPKTQNFPPKNPESLMADINASIRQLEYTRATAYLDSRASLLSPYVSPSSSSSSLNTEASEGDRSRYDAKVADEAYRAGCAALAAGKLDEALLSLNVSLSVCPPDKTSAVAKLQSLISLTSQQLNK